MENQTYKYLYKDVIKALKENHLLQASLSLQGMAATIKSWIAKDEIDNIIDSYHILLSYFANVLTILNALNSTKSSIVARMS